MLIHVAENGRSYELDCVGATTVEVINNTLAALTGIPVGEQMLISGDTRLEPSRNLAFYRLPSEEKHVFLFNRLRLLPDAPPPGQEELEHVEAVLPPAPSVLDVGHPLDESPNPLLRALPSYERQFRFHFQKGQAIFRASQQRFDQCRRLVQENRVQELAMETACGNMGLYYRHICSAHEDFIQQFARQHATHQDLLNSFEQDMDRLRACELHPALRSHNPSRGTLLDCVKEDALRRWAHDCSMSHAHFAGKVAELRTLFADLQRSVEELLQTAPDVDVEHLEAGLEESHKYIEDQGSILQSLSKDLNTVRKLVEDCVSSQLSSSSLRPLDACAALDPMSELHTGNHLPRVEACDRKLAALLQHLRQCKLVMSTCVHRQLQRVASLQSRIRDLRNQLAAFREALARQEEIFAELALLRRVAAAYCACLLEVVRRRAFAEVYLGEARQVAERVARVREGEIALRAKFAQDQSLYLPRDVLEGMGLLGVPSLCEISVPPFDRHLLNIDIAYVQRTCGSGTLLGTFSSSSSSASAAAPSALPAPAAAAGGKAAASPGRGEGGGAADAASDGEDDGGDHHQPGGGLELENARLRADLASALALVYALQAGGGSGGISGASGGASSSSAAAAQDRDSRAMVASKTAEALRLKDQHSALIQSSLQKQRSQSSLYEQRIRELEARLAEQSALLLRKEQQQQLQPYAHHAKSGTGVGSGSGIAVCESESENSLERGLGLSERSLGPPGGSQGHGHRGQAASGGDHMGLGSGRLEVVPMEEGSTLTDVASSSPRPPSVTRESSRGDVTLLDQAPDAPGADSVADTDAKMTNVEGAGTGAGGGGGGGGSEAPSGRQSGGTWSEQRQRQQEEEKEEAAATAASGERYGGKEVAAGGGARLELGNREAAGAGVAGGAGVGGAERNSMLLQSSLFSRGGSSSAGGGGGSSELVIARLEQEEEERGGETGQERERELEGELALLRERLCEVQAEMESERERHLGVLAQASAASSAEVGELRLQLEKKTALLSECQVNSAHLENRLHEAREEARTQRAAAERRARDVRVRGLLERLTRCLAPPPSSSGPPPPAALADTLRSLANSLSSNSGAGDGGEGGGGGEAGDWVVAAVRALAEPMAVLAGDRAQLTQRCLAAEAEPAQLGSKLRALAARHEKTLQAYREKIGFTRFAVHEFAAFVQEESGFWVAVHRGCPHRYLSEESVALLRQQPHTRCIVGQIVHIEKGVARADAAGGSSGGAGSSSNPYGLPHGTSFYVLTVAMIPKLNVRPPSSPSPGRRKSGSSSAGEGSNETEAYA
eukprot:jgi/Mesen1/8287/ME000045S07747